MEIWLRVMEINIYATKFITHIPSKKKVHLGCDTTLWHNSTYTIPSLHGDDVALAGGEYNDDLIHDDADDEVQEEPPQEEPQPDEELQQEEAPQEEAPTTGGKKQKKRKTISKKQVRKSSRRRK